MKQRIIGSETASAPKTAFAPLSDAKIFFGFAVKYLGREIADALAPAI